MAHTHHRMPWSRGRHADEAAHPTQGTHQATSAPPPPATTPTTPTPRTEAGRAETTYAERRDARAHSKFGGTNWGSAFFGWLVAVGMLVVLSAIASVIATAVGANIGLSEDEATREADTIGLGAAITLVVILGIAYYCGGYVAGRMSRFDGARQGLAVWLVGFLVTLLAIGLGLLFGDQYDLTERVDLPRLPLSADELTIGGLVTGLAILLVTLLGAMAGGKVGHRYHNRVDRAAARH